MSNEKTLKGKTKRIKDCYRNELNKMKNTKKAGVEQMTSTSQSLYAMAQQEISEKKGAIIFTFFEAHFFFGKNNL